MSCQVLALHLLRVDEMGSCRLVASSHSPSSSSSSLSAQQVNDVVREKVRLHFNNTGSIEINSESSLFFRVSLSDAVTLCIVCIAHSQLPSSVVFNFLSTVLDGIHSDEQWMSSLARGDDDLDALMQPTFTQYVMTENGKEHAQSTKMSNLQRQVEDVRAVMQNNVEMVMERGERLENIQERSNNLAASSESFKMTARRVQRKFCMLNAKWTIISIVGGILLLVVVILIILSSAGVFNKKN